MLDKLLEYKRSWMQHVNRMPRNRLPRVMKYYFPPGRRNHVRPLKRLLDTWDRNGSTSDPTPWKIYDDDDDDDDVSYIFCFGVPTHRFYVQNSLLCTNKQFFFFACMFCISASRIVWHTSGTNWLFRNLKVLQRVANNRNATASLSWNGIAARNLASLFIIFGPNKLISSSKSAGAIRVNFMWCPIHSWHFKSAN